MNSPETILKSWSIVQVRSTLLSQFSPGTLLEFPFSFLKTAYSSSSHFQIERERERKKIV